MFREGETPPNAPKWVLTERLGIGGFGEVWLAVRAKLAVGVLRTLAHTAAHCHQLKPAVVHRDFKPGNVLVARDGKLKITDFGISDTLARQALDEARRATFSGMTCSTPSLVRWAHTPLYASPQQKDGHDAHPSDDVHALGVMLYQLLFGNINLPLGIDYREHLAELHVCKELLDVLSRSIAATVERPNTLSPQQANTSESGLGRTCKVGLYQFERFGYSRPPRKRLGVVRRRLRWLEPSEPRRRLGRLCRRRSCGAPGRAHADRHEQPPRPAVGPSSRPVARAR